MAARANAFLLTSLFLIGCAPPVCKLVMCVFHVRAETMKEQHFGLEESRFL